MAWDIKRLHLIWRTFRFDDVTPLMKTLGQRPVTEADLRSLPAVAKRVNEPSPWPTDPSVVDRDMRKSPFLSILRYEKKLFLQMAAIHSTDVCLSIAGSLLAVEILKTFEAPKSATGGPLSLWERVAGMGMSQHPGVFAALLAVVIFLFNVSATILHSHKIEREFVLSWRIRAMTTTRFYRFVCGLSRAARQKSQTGDIVNLAQSDGSYMADFFSHAMVDFPVLFLSSALVMALMFSLVGSAAWVALGLVLLQIPLSAFFSWSGGKMHSELMKRSDKRTSLITDWVQGMRIVRYFGWGATLSQEIQAAAKREFRQNVKLTAQYALAFSLSSGWWMVVSVGLFWAYLRDHAEIEASAIFGSLWLTAILGHQLMPMPWFVAAFAQARVASRRLRMFWNLPTLAESHQAHPLPIQTDAPWFDSHLDAVSHGEFPIGLRFVDVSLRFSDTDPWIFQNLSFEAKAHQLTAVVGPVGAGKSLLLLLCLGEILPTKGDVLLVVASPQGAKTLSVLHPLSRKILEKAMAWVPQEAWMASASLRDNIPLRRLSDLLAQNPSDADCPAEGPTGLTATRESSLNHEADDPSILNALYHASFGPDLKRMPAGLDTEIGERGVNLSGGQKQRISLARSVFATRPIVLLDDPLSAVDFTTETELVKSLFDDIWSKNRSLLWCTHRLEYLHKAQHILILDEGRIVEQGTFEELTRDSSSRLNTMRHAMRDTHKREVEHE